MTFEAFLGRRRALGIQEVHESNVTVQVGTSGKETRQSAGSGLTISREGGSLIQHEFPPMEQLQVDHSTPAPTAALVDGALEGSTASYRADAT